MYTPGHEKRSFYRTITLKIPGIPGGNKGTEFSFPDIGDLRYARTVSIDSYCSEDMAVAFPEAVPLISGTQLPSCCLVLNTNDPERKNQGSDGRFTSTIDSIRYLPLTSIHRSNVFNGSVPSVWESYEFGNTWIVWEKSTIRVAPGGFNNTTDICVYLGVWYTFFNTDGKEVKRT